MTIAGLTADDLLEEVIVAPRRAYLPLADLRVIERPGWLQIITPSFRRGGFNEVALAALDPDEADAVIDATIAEYRALGLTFRWAVDRRSAPADLGARLERRGLVPREVVGMARATEDAPPSDGALAIERVDPVSEPLYTAVACAGWGDRDSGPAGVANQVALRDPDRNRLYLARCGGEPAGVAASVMFPRSVYLLGAVVLPAFRRRGLYRALVAARLADAAATGRALATSHARATSSAPLLAKMGFTEVARFTVYEG